MNYLNALLLLPSTVTNQQFPQDFGPIYTETNLGRFPVEPWNTISNLIFLLIVLYFYRRTMSSTPRSRFFLFCLPILFTGFIGGTIYHATRSSRIWLILDFMPIFILSFTSGFYLWQKFFSSWYKTIFMTVAAISFSTLPRSFLSVDRNLIITIGYINLAVFIILPAYLLSRQTTSLKKPLRLSVLCFIPALLFRYVDHLALLPMGTHFLWHILGGFSTFWIMVFVYQVDGANVDS